MSQFHTSLVPASTAVDSQLDRFEKIATSFSSGVTNPVDINQGLRPLCF